jgi:signal transduction histidine kinase
MDDKLFYTVVVTSLIIAVIILFFIISVIKYHRRYIRLQKDRIRAEITMQELERKRIANDLHDSLGPLLSSVKLYVQSIDGITDDDKALLDIASKHIDETITGLREISYNLSPEGLSRNGLIKAIDEYLLKINTAKTLTIDFSADKGITLPKEYEIHVFRIVQEIVNNAMKHSHATLLRLIITTQGNDVMIVSIDDGIGFDPDEIKKHSMGLGLNSIESRCEMLDATLTLTSTKNQGCKYVIKVPKV